MSQSARRAAALVLAALVTTVAGCPSPSDPPADLCGGLSCDDGNPCTDDSCVASACQHADNTAPCDDGSACTSLDACGGGTCAGTAVDCDDGSACTTDSCDPGSGCLHAPFDCDDGNACTVESCDPATGCGHAAVVCNPRPNAQCWNEPTCDSVSGCQQNPRAVGTLCEDGNACTTGDECNAVGACVEMGSTACIPPGNAACYVARSCDPITGCGFDFAAAATPCDDGDLCATGDQCDGAGGCAGSPVSCSASACSVASCNPATGACDVTPGPSGLPCDDANACTTSDTCSLGACQGATTDCDDADACTSETCDAATGCAHGPVSCDDGIACTVDSCDASTGCLHVPNDAVCDDGNACTADSCDSATGCAHTPVTCDDGDACNGVETCDPAVGCKTGAAPTCTDGKFCTVDSCDPASGCTFLPLPSTTVCAPPSCVGNASVGVAHCDGAGLCSVPVPVNCGTYLCNGASGSCFTSCASGANCSSGSYCNAAQCVAKSPLGAMCVVNFDCASGWCTDGVCCDRACSGQCEACNMSASGICTFVPFGQNPGGECGPLTCDGGGGCQ